MKLKEKTRIGSKVKKKHDTAKTPYQRVLESPYISEESKDKLRAQYVKLNPAELKRQITRLQNKLLRLTSLKEQLRKRKSNDKTLSSEGYLGMGWSEKIDCRAFYEAGFSGLTHESILSDNIDLEDDKKAELIEVDFT